MDVEVVKYSISRAQSNRFDTIEPFNALTV